MPSALGLLEQRIAAAADLIAGLRDRVARLEHELESLSAGPAAGPAAPQCDPSLLEELARLRAERSMVRDRIRGLMKEIDRLS